MTFEDNTKKTACRAKLEVKVYGKPVLIFSQRRTNERKLFKFSLFQTQKRSYINETNVIYVFICVLRRYFYVSLTITPQNVLIALFAFPNIK